MFRFQRRATSLSLALSLAASSIFAPVHAPAAQTKTSLGSLSKSFEDITQKVRPSVVSVLTTGFRPADGSGLLSKERGTGSGVILDADGYIVTNAHVVEGARRVQVMIPFTEEELAQRRSILKSPGRLIGGQVVGVDRETDLAVIKVQQKGLRALTLADSDEVRQGQIVLAFGSPFGFENSVSMGVVSSVARQLAPEHPVVYIQTDATINPGNSGGPLVNDRGEVVGVNTLIFSRSGGSEGIGFSVPSNIVKNVFQQIRSTGRVRRGEIGVHAQTIDPVMARGLGLEQTAGVIIGDVYPGSPAERAGLQIGDVVLRVAGKPMENGRQFDVNIYRQTVGARVAIEYVREGKERVADVEVVQRPVDSESFSEFVHPEDNLVPRLGILALNLTPSIAAMLPLLRIDEGVVVAAQSSDGPAWRESFMPGDVIYAINGRRVRDIDSLRTLLRAFAPGDAVVAQVQRGPRFQFLAFDME